MTNLSHPVILKFRNHQVCCYVVVSWIYLHCIEKYLHCIEKFKILTLVLVNDYITTCSLFYKLRFSSMKCLNEDWTVILV